MCVCVAVVRTESEGEEVVDAADEARSRTVVVEESLRVELARVVPRRLVQMDRLVVGDDDRVARDRVATQLRVLLGRVRDAQRHCAQQS